MSHVITGVDSAYDAVPAGVPNVKMATSGVTAEMHERFIEL